LVLAERTQEVRRFTNDYIPAQHYGKAADHKISKPETDVQPIMRFMLKIFVLSIGFLLSMNSTRTIKSLTMAIITGSAIGSIRKFLRHLNSMKEPRYRRLHGGNSRSWDSIIDIVGSRMCRIS
jgi:hypothetical protein